MDLETEPESLETERRRGHGDGLMAVVVVAVLTRSILVLFDCVLSPFFFPPFSSGEKC